MNYVCTGLFGRLDRLKKIEQMTLHNNDDRLYIIGDVLSIGKDPFEMVSYIKEHPQMILLKSGSMKLALLCLTSNHKDLNRTYWLNCLNGGNIRTCLERRKDKESLISYMLSLHETETVSTEDTTWKITGYEIRKSDMPVICRTYEKKEKAVNGNIIGLNPKDAYAVCIENMHTYKYFDHKSCTVQYNKFTGLKML